MVFCPQICLNHAFVISDRLGLSLGDFYQQLIEHLPAAVPNTERVPSRFMIVPLVFLIVIACARFQRLHQRFTHIRWLGLGMLAAVAALLVQLRQHWALWRMSSIERNYATLAPHRLAMPNIIKMDDPAYLHAVHLTLAFSALVLVALVGAVLWRRWRRGAGALVAQEFFAAPLPAAVTLGDRKRTVRWALAVGGLLVLVAVGGEVYRWATPEGLWVTYFKDKHLNLPAWRGVERDLVRDFQEDPPVPWIIPGGFSSRWTGYLVVPRDDEYIFYAQSSDGVRLYLDGQRVLDKWREQVFLTSGTATNLFLKAGLHPLMLEHFSHDSTGAVRVRWCGGGIPENTLLAAPYLRKRP